MRHPRRSSDDEPSKQSDRLADAAIAVIARDGIDALSVRSVAREADVTGGAVQHHFPTKDVLTIAAFDRALRRQTARVALHPASAPAATPTSVVDRLVRDLCSILPADIESRQEAIVWIAMSAAVTGNEALAVRHAGAVAKTRLWISAAVRSAVTAGEVDAAIDPAQVAPLIEAALDGMMLQAIAADDSHRVLCARLATMVGALLGYRVSSGDLDAGRSASRRPPR